MDNPNAFSAKELDAKQWELYSNYSQWQQSTWNGIISVNGILLSAFAVAATISNKLPLLLTLSIILSSIVAIILILWNCQARYNLASEIHNNFAETPLSENGELLPTEKNDKLSKKAAKEQILIECREKWAYVFTALSGIFVLIIICLRK